MAPYLVLQGYVNSNDDLTELFYQAFWTTKRAELKKWMTNKDLMVISKDRQYFLPTLKVLKQVASLVV